MSSVYLAEQESFQRQVAIKILPAIVAESKDYGPRFLREARIAANLSHPSIVTVFDTGFHEGSYYLAMEHLPGGDLKQRFAAGISIAETLDIVQDIAYALDYAQDKGVVHRDIKPANIMFREDGSLAIVDFGIAREFLSDMQMTQTGVVVGTPNYMSPEQSAGREIDSRADVYALGILLFELLTGYVPFSASGAAAIGVKHLTAKVPRLPRALRALQPPVNRALQKKPEDRFQRGSEFALAIEELRGKLPAALLDTVVRSEDADVTPSGSRSRSGGSTSSSALRLRRSTHERLHSRSRALASERRWRLWTVAAILFVGVVLAIDTALEFGLPATLFDSTEETPVTGDPDPASPGLETAIPTPDATDADPGDAPASLDEPDEDHLTVQLLVLDYVETAEGLLEQGELAQAENYLRMATDLGPEEPWVIALLETARESHRALSARNARTAALIEQARRQLEDGDLYTPAASNAYLSIDALAQLSQSIPDSEQLRSQADRRSAEYITGLIRAGRLDRAGRELELWRPYATAGVQATVSDQLNAARGEAVRRATELESALQSATQLAARSDTSAAHQMQLVASYQGALALDPDSRAAREGLALAADAAVTALQQELDAGNLEQVGRAVPQLTRLSPIPVGLPALESRLSELELRRATARSQLREASDRLDSLPSQPVADTASPVQSRAYASDLLNIYAMVQLSAELDPTLPGRESVIETIEQKYYSIFSRYLETGRIEFAQLYRDELESSRLKSPGVRNLLQTMGEELEAATPVKRRPFNSF